MIFAELSLLETIEVRDKDFFKSDIFSESAHGWIQGRSAPGWIQGRSAPGWIQGRSALGWIQDTG